MSKLLTIIAIELKADKNTRQYKNIVVATSETQVVVDDATGEVVKVKTKSKTATIKAYEKSYLNDKADFGWDFKVGDKVMGDIITRKVPAYTIPDKETGELRTVDTYSCAVLGDTESLDEFERAIYRTFKAKEHDISPKLVTSIAIADPKVEPALKKEADEAFAKVEKK